jgi:hypothetical protein
MPTSAAPVSAEGQAIQDVGGIADIPIKVAVRATSAAPTYFPPVEMVKGRLGGVEFWDGGLLNNNPIDQLWRARVDLVQDTEPLPKVACVLSLGTSWSDKVPGLLDSWPKVKGFLEWVKDPPKITILKLTVAMPIPDMIKNLASSIASKLSPVQELIPFLTNTEAKHVDFARYMQRMANRVSESESGTKYFRFNTPTKDKYIDMSDWEKMRDLKGITEDWLKAEDVWIDKVATVLAKKSK